MGSDERTGEAPYKVERKKIRWGDDAQTPLPETPGSSRPKAYHVHTSSADSQGSATEPGTTAFQLGRCMSPKAGFPNYSTIGDEVAITINRTTVSKANDWFLNMGTSRLMIQSRFAT